MKRVTILLCVMAAVIIAVSHAAQAAVVVVTPGNMDGWAFYQTDNGGIINQGSQSGQAAMVTGPGTPPLGSGSANLRDGSGHGDEAADSRTIPVGRERESPILPR